MRCIITLSMAMAILCAALGFSTLASAEVAPVNISGAWKIESKNGPSPVCGFEQAGNNITGSCTGPNANGTITGTIFGEQVRWHWQWGTYAGNAAAAFDFKGILRPDNTITGVVKRPEIGLSLNFTAKRAQSTSGPFEDTAAPAMQGPAGYTNAQCGSNNKIYIDPRLAPGRIRWVQEILRDYINSPSVSEGRKRDALEQYRLQDSPSEVPYAGGKVLINAKNSCIQQFIPN